MEAQIRAGDSRQRLPVGTMLDNFYRIEGEIGSGGFGITYRGRDMKLGLPVAIKEYFPAEVGSRDSTMSVYPLTQGQGDVFQWGRQGFIREAQMLASFKHQGIVRVLRYFEAHNTAYMVLEFEEGPSLARWLDRLQRPPTQAEMDKIASGLMDALEVIHHQRLVHRDIAPDNVIVRADGSPVLLDFGAARYEVAEASRTSGQSVHTRSFAIVKAHYSPFEQRSTDTRLRGPWSDIYSLGATLYRAITGVTPSDSHDRMGSDSDPVMPTAHASKGHFRPGFLAAIDRAMLLKRQERPQTIAEFRAQAFATDGIVPLMSAPAGNPNTASPPSPGAAAKSFSEIGDHRRSGGAGEPTPSQFPRIAAALAGVALIAGVGMWMQRAATTVAPPSGQGATATPSVIVPRGERRDERSAGNSDDARRTDEAKKAVAVARERAEDAARAARATREREEKDVLERQTADARRRAEADLRAAQEAEKRAEERRKKAEEEEKAHRNPPPPPVGPTLWTHNGSTMRLVSNGSQRRFLYVNPRAGLSARGVKDGTLLFEGEKSGKTYSGRSRVFHATCGAYPYDVSGTVSDDDRRVVMFGQKPILSATCQVERSEADELIFEFASVDNPSPTIPISPVSNWPRFDKRWVKGDGYNMPPPVVANDGDCKAICQGDPACRMYEFYKPKRLCNLYAHQVVEPDAGDSIVGLKP